MLQRIASSALFLLAVVYPFHAAAAAPAVSAERARVEAVAGSIFEVVVRKPKQDSLTYERPLPLDQVPYAIRNDPYYSVGTAFAIGPNRWVTAAHVLDLGRESLVKTYRLRDAEGRVYEIDQFLKLSLRRDFAVFSIKGGPSVRPLPTYAAPRVNDKVYAAGNALGQGVVLRDGLFTSRTPEERDGAWQWLRFSAAASPGNSGGPLLDERGRVIGVVVRKSENENLNFALPIGEVLGATEVTAEIDTEMLYIIDNMPNLSHREKLVMQVALPKTYEELDAALTPAFNAFGRKLKEELFRAQAGRVFPNGAASTELLHTTHNAVMPGIVGLGKDGNWDVFFAKQTHTGDLGANGRYTYGDFYSSQVFLLTKPADVSLSALYSDSKLLMDLMLRGNPLYRTMGADQVRIVSMGKAREERTHTDAYGRKWRVRLWDIEEFDQKVLLFALPVPGGAVGMMRRVPAAMASGHLIDLYAFADFLYVSYYGTLAQWQELLARRELLPTAFADIRVDLEFGRRFEYASPRLAFSYDAQQMAVTPNSDLKLQFAYFMDNGRVVWDVAKVIVGDDKDNSTVFVVSRNVHPTAQLDDKFRARWGKIAQRKPPFDKSAFKEEMRTLVGDVVPGGLPEGSLAQAPLLYTALYAVEGKIENRSVEARFDAFVRNLKIKEY
jgi:hypothetical protein